MDINIHTASKDELIEYATTIGIELDTKDTKADIIGKIEVALGEADADAPLEAGSVSVAPEVDLSKNRYLLTISTSENDKQPVQIGVNGKLTVIKRGVQVEVGGDIIEVLKNATMTKYDPETMEPSEVPLYPFSAIPK